MKECTTCHKKYPKSKYRHRIRYGRDYWETKCKRCELKRNQAARLANHRANRDVIHARHKDGRLRRTYGITLEEFQARWDAQNGRCKVCYVALRHGIGGASVDHCHKTLKVRGILCTGCNRALGFARDDAAVLRGLLKYLEDFTSAH